MSDRNYRSYNGPHHNHASETVGLLDPQPPLWTEGSWSDTLKFSDVYSSSFRNAVIKRGGKEDAVDINNKTNWCEFIDFRLSADGRYALTLKGGSSNNFFANWTITKPAKFVDIAVGEWSDQSMERCENNVFENLYRSDGTPVSYAYRWGCRPIFFASNVRHLWWLSIGITIHCLAKWLWKKIKK